MSDHYFSKRPQSKSNRITWQTNLCGHNLVFTTDVGVFSKDRVDFGSRLLIESFTEPDVAGEILDLGCGYGPVGIAIATILPQREVVMSDVNERAVSLAKLNAKQNKASKISIEVSDRFAQLSGQFAAILLNPPIRAGKAIVYKMFDESYQSLKKSGELWIVIQKKQGAPSANKKLRSLFGNVHLIQRERGYYIYKAIKLD